MIVIPRKFMDTIMGRKTKFLSIIIIPGFFYLLTSIVAVPVLENGSLNSEWRENDETLPRLPSAEMESWSDGRSRRVSRESNRVSLIRNISEEESAIGKDSVTCVKPGYIPDPSDCIKFFSCVLIQSEFELIPLSCINGMTFEDAESKCVSSRSTSCDREKETRNRGTQTRSHTPRNSEIDSNEIEKFLISDEADDVEEFHVEGGEMVESPAEIKSRTNVVHTRHLSPRTWFGLVGTNKKLGNPFKEYETSLALILDFSTSRLQIYSRNKPRK